MQNRLTDVQIAARIVPTMLRWPEAEIATTVAWDRLRDCVTELRDLVRTVDDSCLQAETGRDMSPDGIARQRAALGTRALAELANFRPFQIAEKVVTENIASEQAQMQQQLTKALNDLREGIAAAKRMLRERCKLREGYNY